MKIANIEIYPKELGEFKYWLHLFIIVYIVYFLINQFVQPMEITLNNVALGVIFIGIADIFAHTILKIS